MSEEQQSSGGEQVTPSAEQQPGPTTTPEQHTPDPAQQPAPVPAEQVPPAGDPDETTDAGDGAGDRPTADEIDAAGDGNVTEPPPNPHTEEGAEGSAGLGVTGKFVTDDEAPEDAGDEDAGNP